MKFGTGSNAEGTQKYGGSKYKMTYIHVQTLSASERSERDTYRVNTIENRGCLFIYLFIWRASEASETVLGVDNAKSGICYSASERSERS